MVGNDTSENVIFFFNRVNIFIFEDHLKILCAVSRGLS